MCHISVRKFIRINNWWSGTDPAIFLFENRICRAYPPGNLYFFEVCMASIPISVQGYKKLENELAQLKSERPQIIQAIKEAREEGDLRENAGYDAARERQGMAEARIKYIESRLGLYQVVDLDNLQGEKAIFGATVSVEDVDSGETREYTILGPDEADPSKGSISFLSPVGQALLGKEEGDEVTIDIPRGKVTYEITEISFRGSGCVGG